jgi:hypothetical protein
MLLIILGTITVFASAPEAKDGEATNDMPEDGPRSLFVE